MALVTSGVSEESPSDNKEEMLDNPEVQFVDGTVVDSWSLIATALLAEVFPWGCKCSLSLLFWEGIVDCSSTRGERQMGPEIGVSRLEALGGW